MCKGWVLFQKLDDAIGQLWVVDAQGLHLVERDQDLCGVSEGGDRK